LGIFIFLGGIALKDWNNPQDNACKSIGYNTSVNAGYQNYYCVDENRRIHVAFKNCGFTTCEIYKLEEEDGN
ncbi:MAG: hypothetical protein AABY22_23585, partial [Nanoarchaeota archaeon]